jgi:hypothetical protein
LIPSHPIFPDRTFLTGLFFQGGAVRTVNTKGPTSVLGSDWTIMDQIVSKDVLESRFTESTQETINKANGVGGSNFISRVKGFVCGYGGEESGGNRGRGDVGVKNEETGRLFDELHEGTILMVHSHTVFVKGVNGNAAALPDGGEREDVGDGLRIVPNRTVNREVANHGRVLVAAVGDGTKIMWARTDVGENAQIHEDGYTGL